MMTESETVSGEFVEVVRNLIAYFVQRQRIVVMAMLDLHPAALTRGTDKLLGIDVEPYLERFREKAEKDRSWQLGVWKGDWKHWVHGQGCKLTNLRTGEMIEWDAPDVNAFDLYWFWENLEWRLAHETEDPYIRGCLKWMKKYPQDLAAIKEAINNLVNVHVLMIRHNHKTSLLPANPPTKLEIIPDEVVNAFLDLISEYSERQSVVVTAARECRDHSLRDQEGVWREVWRYQFWRSGVYTLSHIHTGEPFAWVASNPQAVSSHGFEGHLSWRMTHECEDEKIQIVLEWAERWTKAHFNEWDESYFSTAISVAFEDLIERHVIVLKLQSAGLSIEVVAPA